MKLLCTFPGRHGDILWALPTVRAISESIGEPVDLMIAGEFVGLIPLLAQQPYIHACWAALEWSLSEPEAVPTAHLAYDHILHLGYKGWPLLDLPHQTEQAAREQTSDALLSAPIDLKRPWITTKLVAPPTELAIGFTEAWFELKLGLAVALEQLYPYVPRLYLTLPHSRWTFEVPPGTLSVQACNWVQAAGIIRNSDRFFGDCSALHVLACAMGKPVVLCEPMEGRWNDIFYPYGKTGPEVTLVLGNDGQPTFDARACAKALRG